MSCPSKGKVYTVTVVPSSLASKLRLSGKYKLQIDKDGLDLYVDHWLKLMSWPFAHIKSYWNECKRNKYGIYAGPRCPSGEGEFIFEFKTLERAEDFKNIISNGIKTGFKDILRPVSDQIDYKGYQDLADLENEKVADAEDNWTLKKGIYSQYFVSILPPTHSGRLGNSSSRYSFIRGRRSKSLDEEPVSTVH